MQEEVEGQEEKKNTKTYNKMNAHKIKQEIDFYQLQFQELQGEIIGTQFYDTAGRLVVEFTRDAVVSAMIDAALEVISKKLDLLKLQYKAALGRE